MQRIVEIAKVVDNQDPLGFGRIKVKLQSFAVQPEIWLRMTTFYANASTGVVFFPEIGDEMLVLRGAEDDPNRMFIIGALYNGDHKPAYDNADGENITKQMVTRSGNRMVYSDKSGEEGILLETQAGTRIRMSDKSDKLGLDIESSDGTIRISLDKNGGSVTVANQKGMTIVSDGDAILESKNGNVTVKGAANVTLEAGAHLEVKGGAQVTVSAPIVELSGSMVRIN